MSTPALLLWLTIAGFLLFSLCSNLLYWYEVLNHTEAAIPQQKPGLLLCLKQYCITLGGYVVCIGVFPFGLFMKYGIQPPRSGKSERHPPVILIHGLNNNAAVWLYLGHLLKKNGYNVSTFSYSSLFVPLPTIMSRLDAHIRAVSALGHAKAPVLICHSLGGILARNWMTEQDNPELSGLITLGTPHGGSKLAVMAPGALAKNITPKAALIAKLRAAGTPGGIPCVSLVSPADEAVHPAANLLPPDGWGVRLTPRVGHFSMLFYPSVARMVLEEVNKCQSGMPWQR